MAWRPPCYSPTPRPAALIRDRHRSGAEHARSGQCGRRAAALVRIVPLRIKRPTPPPSPKQRRGPLRSQHKAFVRSQRRCALFRCRQTSSGGHRLVLRELGPAWPECRYSPGRGSHSNECAARDRLLPSDTSAVRHTIPRAAIRMIVTVRWVTAGNAGAMVSNHGHRAQERLALYLRPGLRRALPGDCPPVPVASPAEDSPSC